MYDNHVVLKGFQGMDVKKGEFSLAVLTYNTRKTCTDKCFQSLHFEEKCIKGKTSRVKTILFLLFRSETATALIL